MYRLKNNKSLLRVILKPKIIHFKVKKNYLKYNLVHDSKVDYS